MRTRYINPNKMSTYKNPNSREKKINVKPEKCKTQHVGVITKDSFLQKMKHSKIRHSFGIQTN